MENDDVMSIAGNVLVERLEKYFLLVEKIIDEGKKFSTEHSHTHRRAVTL